MYSIFQPFKKGARIIYKNPGSILSEFVTAEECGLKFNFPIPVMKRGKGPYLYDYDGNRYVDFYLDGGNLLLGHSPPRVTKIIKSWLNRFVSGGYPTTTHQLLTRNICSAFLKHSSDPARQDTYWFYFDSPFEACLKLLLLLQKYTDRKKGVYVLFENNHSQNISPFSGLSLPRFTIDQVEKISIEKFDFVVFTPHYYIEAERIAEFFFRCREKGLLVISDETEYCSFISISVNREVCTNIDIRVFGKWIASGLSFGCAAVNKTVFKKSNILGKFQKHPCIYKLFGFPPLYKLKAAVRFAGEIEKLGGIQALQKKISGFHEMLDKRFFELDQGTIYIKNPELLQSSWQKWHRNLLEKNFLFPPSPFYPINISLSHSDELIVKCARGINSVFSYQK